MIVVCKVYDVEAVPQHGRGLHGQIRLTSCLAALVNNNHSFVCLTEMGMLLVNGTGGPCSELPYAGLLQPFQAYVEPALHAERLIAWKHHGQKLTTAGDPPDGSFEESAIGSSAYKNSSSSEADQTNVTKPTRSPLGK